MLNSRLFSLIRKEFIQIVRDPRTLALTFLMPLIQLVLLGYAATNDVRNVPLAVFDQDKLLPQIAVGLQYKNNQDDYNSVTLHYASPITARTREGLSRSSSGRKHFLRLGRLAIRPREIFAMPVTRRDFVSTFRIPFVAQR